MTVVLARRIWEEHLVRRAAGAPDLLYVDLHLVHEVSSPQAFDGLRATGRRVRRPDLTLALEDHAVPTAGIGLPIADPLARTQVEALRRNCTESASGCTRSATRTRASCTSSPRSSASRSPA
jgi:3-isopropylmalate/(R)-2-methylmalate dehydratase large subunit